jgi:hypothetical protein
MDAYDRCTNLGKKILPIFLPSMVVAENFETTHVYDLFSMLIICHFMLFPQLAHGLVFQQVKT